MLPLFKISAILPFFTSLHLKSQSFWSTWWRCLKSSSSPSCLKILCELYQSFPLVRRSQFLHPSGFYTGLCVHWAFPIPCRGMLGYARQSQRLWQAGFTVPAWKNVTSGLSGLLRGPAGDRGKGVSQGVNAEMVTMIAEIFSLFITEAKSTNLSRPSLS